MGFQQQKGYPEMLPEILAALCDHPTFRHGIDFVLHGGDMIAATSEEHILAATKAFDLAVPVYLCLGNHDLTAPDAIDQWLSLAPQFFKGGSPNYTIASGDCVVHVTPNHWGETPFYWDGSQRPHFRPDQLDQLSHELRAGPEVPRIILTHSPAHGLPKAQTGLADPYHSPGETFGEQVTTFAASHENAWCVLGAHNHLNMCINRGGTEFVTVSSLVETPFEFKLFEVSPERMVMTTMSLAPDLAFDHIYDASKSFVQGRDIDRCFARESVTA